MRIARPLETPRTWLFAWVVALLFVFSTPASLIAQSVEVWVNTSSSVYHCAGTRYFRATKSGTLMSESRARQAGNRPAYGKVCGREEAPAEPGRVPEVRGVAQASLARTSDVRVWVNTKSNVYHCAGTRYFGNTKSGRYMTQTAAKADGNRPAYGSECAQ